MLHEASRMKGILIGLMLAACATSPGADGGDLDLDADSELAAMLADQTPEQPAVDPSSEAALDGVACTKTRYLHIADYSFVPPLHEAGGVVANGCWGFQRRANGFTCEYSATSPSYVKTEDHGGPFASYNEIKPLNAHDATAVAACAARSGRAVRTYTAWNGDGWNREGIAAAVSFAEVYGIQADASSKFWTWYGSERGTFAPMGNVSPETRVTFDSTKDLVARLCSATRDQWVGLYFYDGQAAGGAGMAEWKAEAIIRGMNYCTTH
jgi:hypothetical protein